MKVKGKEQLCVCDEYRKYFKSFQGLDGHTLFERYKDLENIVNKRVDDKYRHFLAQPEVDGNTIQWFSVPYYEEPKRLSELTGVERTHYENIKNDTLSHFRKVVEDLSAQGKKSESEALGNAIKFVNDDFVYCYDGKIVLGVWGMELRNEVREPLGIAMKNTFEKPRKKKTPMDTDNSDTIGADDGFSDSNNENDIEGISSPEEDSPKSPQPPEFPKSFKVNFLGGEHGNLRGQTEYNKYYEEQVKKGEIPEVLPADGYRFIGWDKDPVDYVVREDTEFTALYEEVENNEEGDKVSFCHRFWGWGSGCLNWLLTLLLLGLIGLLLWYLLSGYRNFNFCGNDCGCDEVVVVDTVDEKPDPTPTPDPTLRPCDELQKSGSNQPQSFVFDMGQESGSFLFEYATGAIIPDKIIIHDGEHQNDNVIFQFHDVTGDGGWISRKKQKIQFNHPKIYIEIIPEDDPETYWEIKVNCPK